MMFGGGSFGIPFFFLHRMKMVEENIGKLK